MVPSPAAKPPGRNADLSALLRVVPLLLGLLAAAGAMWWFTTADDGQPVWLSLRPLQNQLVDGGIARVQLTLQPEGPSDARALRSLMPGLEAVVTGTLGGRRSTQLRGADGLRGFSSDLKQSLDDYLEEHGEPPLRGLQIEQLVVAADGALPGP